jgi:(4-(4-[2-(gamma-L-glutamylamino)ethyl]phenoxymethyl)furan-2-yl)methanamine synthase
VPSEVLGWDVGGANIKLARLDVDRWGGQDGPPLQVVERAFPIWRDPAGLPAVLAAMATDVPPASPMALTMTAELADCFATKRDGVEAVIGAAEGAFPAATLWVYGVDGRFRSPSEARQEPHMVAAANWMATATLVAREHRDALLLDVGSTTTDIIPIVAGGVAAVGRTDPERLRSGELVYSGCLRTPVCAIVRSLPLAGTRCRVAAEHFAITADVYRWLERIGDDDYTCDTPDGRGRSRSEAGARLARMVCADSETLSESDVTAIASHVAQTQTRQIAHGIRQVMRRLNPGPRVAVVVGSGAFVARATAELVDLAACEPSSLTGANAWRVAPAAAVAYLLAEQCFEAVRADRPIPPKGSFRGGGPVPPKRPFRGGGPVPPKRPFRGGG